MTSFRPACGLKICDHHFPKRPHSVQPSAVVMKIAPHVTPCRAPYLILSWRLEATTPSRGILSPAICIGGVFDSYNQVWEQPHKGLTSQQQRWTRRTPESRCIAATSPAQLAVVVRGLDHCEFRLRCNNSCSFGDRVVLGNKGVCLRHGNTGTINHEPRTCDEDKEAEATHVYFRIQVLPLTEEHQDSALSSTSRPSVLSGKRVGAALV